MADEADKANRTPGHVKITQKQSSELVKTLLSIVISTITAERKVFPADFFQRRVFDASDDDTSYRAFMDGNNDDDSDTDLAGYRVPCLVLLRGKSPLANELVDWVELGIHDALDKQFLKRVQLSFYDGIGQGAVIPSNIIESHTMTFTYSNIAASMLVGTASRTRKRDSVVELVLTQTQEGVAEALLSVKDHLALLSDLPNDKSVVLHLEYNSSAPPDYDAPKFGKSKESHLLLMPGEGVAHLDSGFYAVQVSASSKFRKVLDRQSSTESTESPPHNSMAVESPTTSESTEDLVERSTPMSVSTQPSNMKKLRPVGRSRHENGPTQDTMPLDRVTLRGSQFSVHHTTEQESGLALSPHDRSINQPYQEHHHLNQQQGQDTQQGEFDDTGEQRKPCECGVASNEENVTKCDNCSRYFHAQCYGYLDVVQVPQGSTCYTCLLVSDQDRLDDMKMICWKRRILHQYSQKTHSSSFRVTQLAPKIGCGSEELKEITSALQAEGDKICNQESDPVPATKDKSKGKSKPRKSQKYNLKEDKAKLRRVYFDPGLKIAHLLKTQPTNAPALSMSGRSSISSISNHVSEQGSTTQGTPSPDRQPPSRASSLRSASTFNTPNGRRPLDEVSSNMNTSRKRTHNRLSITPTTNAPNKRAKENNGNSAFVGSSAHVVTRGRHW